MPFYYDEDVYQKDQLGTRLDKRHIKEVNVISRKENVASLSGALSPSAGVLGSRAS